MKLYDKENDITDQQPQSKNLYEKNNNFKDEPEFKSQIDRNRAK